MANSKDKAVKYRVMEYLDRNGGIIGWAFLENKEYKRWLKHDSGKAGLKPVFHRAYCVITGYEQAAEWGDVMTSGIRDAMHVTNELPPKSQAYNTDMMTERFQWVGGFGNENKGDYADEFTEEDETLMNRIEKALAEKKNENSESEASCTYELILKDYSDEKGEEIGIYRESPNGDYIIEFTIYDNVSKPPVCKAKTLGPFIDLEDVFWEIDEIAESDWLNMKIISLDFEKTLFIRDSILNLQIVKEDKETYINWKNKIEQWLTIEDAEKDKLPFERMLTIIAEGESMDLLVKNTPEGNLFYYKTDSSCLDDDNDVIKDKSYIIKERGPYQNLSLLLNETSGMGWYLLMPENLNKKYHKILEKAVLNSEPLSKASIYRENWADFFKKPDKDTFSYWRRNKV